MPGILTHASMWARILGVSHVRTGPIVRSEKERFAACGQSQASRRSVAGQSHVSHSQSQASHKSVTSNGQVSGYLQIGEEVLIAVVRVPMPFAFTCAPSLPKMSISIQFSCAMSIDWAEHFWPVAE